jgi:enoyl-CoA hydratase/carnithine racemase
MTENRTRIDREGAIATLWLTRADKHNGMDFALLRAVVAAQKDLTRMSRIGTVRAVVLAGDGPSFCAGLDFKSVLAKPLAAASMATQLLWPVRNVFQTWSMGFRDLPVPVIAAIHGSCFGAGFQLALGADIRFARADARFSIMEAKWGLVPDMGGAALLRELVPIDVAKELTFTGRIISGSEAHALGLVTHLADDPVAAATTLAEEIATRSPAAVSAGKNLLHDAWRGSERKALSAERRWQRRIIGRAEQRALMTGNTARKPPAAA